jgi:hypothetical protein
MSLLQRKHVKQVVKAQDHLMGDVDEGIGQRMRMSPIAKAILKAATPHLLTGEAPPGSRPRPGFKVTETSSEQSPGRAGR